MSDLFMNIDKKHTTQTLKESIEDIKEDVLKQDNNLLPHLNSVDANLTHIFGELFNSINDGNLNAESFREEIDMEAAQLWEVERNVDAEKEIAEKKNKELVFLKSCADCENTEMQAIVQNHTSVMKEIGNTFREAPVLYVRELRYVVYLFKTFFPVTRPEDKKLMSEVDELKKSADKLKETLSEMEKEIEMLQQLFLNNVSEDVMYKSVKTVMKEAGDADFMISWLSQNGKEWIEKNKKLSLKIIQEDCCDGDGAADN